MKGQQNRIELVTRPDFQQFGVQLAFKYSNEDEDYYDEWGEFKTKVRAAMIVIATTEQNCYGLAWGRWFDGHVSCPYALLLSGVALRMKSVTEYINMGSRYLANYSIYFLFPF